MSVLPLREQYVLISAMGRDPLELTLFAVPAKKAAAQLSAAV